MLQTLKRQVTLRGLLKHSASEGFRKAGCALRRKTSRCRSCPSKDEPEGEETSLAEHGAWNLGELMTLGRRSRELGKSARTSLGHAERKLKR